MSDDGPDHCKLFVNSIRSYEWLLGFLAGTVGGDAKKFPNQSHRVDVFLDENDEHDRARLRQSHDGFLYFPFTVDVERRDGVGLQDYIQACREICSGLRVEGCTVVPACEFEEELSAP